MLLDEGLVGSYKEVLVIAARHALPLYGELHAYICKVGRAFRPVKRIAFYSNNEIHPFVPLIQGQYDEVVFERGKNSGRLGELVDQALKGSERDYWPYKWSVHKVFLLSAPDAPETVKLKEPIENDLTSSTGVRTAFTQSQRYVSLEALEKARHTSQLNQQ